MDEQKKQGAPAPRSFRVSDEVMEKLKTVQTDLGLTQDGALRMLMDTYELETAKSAIPSRETEISNFQVKAEELISAFIHSLQLCQDAEARIKAEVAEQMASKDEILLEYQGQLKAERERTAALMQEQAELRLRISEADGLRDELEKAHAAAAIEAESFRAQLADKESINVMQKIQLAAAEEKAAAYDEKAAEAAKLAADLQAAKAADHEHQRDAKEAAREAARQAEKDQQEALDAQRKTLSDDLRKLQVEKDAKIADLQGQLAAALVAAEKEAREAEKAAAAEIRGLQSDLQKTTAENGDLRAQLAELKAELKAAKTELAMSQKAKN